MTSRFILFICLIFSLAACTPPEPNGGGIQTGQIEQVKHTQVILPTETLIPTENIEETDIVETPTTVEQLKEIPPEETSGPDCYGSEPNHIALGIVEKFEKTNYEQVMVWFCNGAEFENILVALQTEKQTGYQAEGMLMMLAAGQTWEEIWYSIGLFEE